MDRHCSECMICDAWDGTNKGSCEIVGVCGASGRRRQWLRRRSEEAGLHSLNCGAQFVEFRHDVVVGSRVVGSLIGALLSGRTRQGEVDAWRKAGQGSGPPCILCNVDVLAQLLQDVDLLDVGDDSVMCLVNQCTKLMVLQSLGEDLFRAVPVHVFFQRAKGALELGQAVLLLYGSSVSEVRVLHCG